MAFTPEEYVSRCEGLVPGLTSRAGEAETLRRLPEATLKEAEEAAILPAVLASSLGGHGLGLESLCQGTRVLAHGCPASAWTLSFFMLHAWLLSKFPVGSRDDFYGSGRFPMMAAPLAPTGRLEPADGGFTVRGRWDFATGVAHADWVMVHCVEPGPDFATRFAVVAADDATVDDVWFTSGMRATGSNTVVVDGAFVPEHRTLSGRALMDGSEQVEGDALANLPLVSVLALTASAPAVGAAEAAVELYRHRLEERVLAYSPGDKAAEQPAAQVRLATSASEARTMRAAWDSAIRAVGVAADRGAVDDRVRVDTRLAAAAAVRSARRIIGSIGEGSGASVYRSEHPLQRLQRDVETMKGHVVFDWDRTAELAGRVMLGGELGPADLV